MLAAQRQLFRFADNGRVSDNPVFGKLWWLRSEEWHTEKYVKERRRLCCREALGGVRGGIRAKGSDEGCEVEPS